MILLQQQQKISLRIISSLMYAAGTYQKLLLPNIFCYLLHCSEFCSIVDVFKRFFQLCLRFIIFLPALLSSAAAGLELLPVQVQLELVPGDGVVHPLPDGACGDWPAPPSPRLPRLVDCLQPRSARQCSNNI